MEYLVQMDSNQRTCPFCKSTITHKNEKDAIKADSLKKPCVSCRYSTRSKPALLTCPRCNFSSKKKTNFADHIVDVHGIELKALWDETFNGPIMCPCGCGQEPTFIDWQKGYNEFVIGHNASLSKVYDATKAKEISDKRREKLTGQVGWAKGLTKRTDERIASRAAATSAGRTLAFKEGRITAWSKGLSKESDPRLAQMSSELTQRYADGELVPWAKGLSKANDERIRAMAFKVSMTHQNKSLRQRLDEIKRLQIDEVKARIEEGSTLRVLGTDGSYVNDAQRNIMVECIKCKSTFSDSLRRLQHGRCYTCDPGGSKAQHQIANWIGTLVSDVQSNCRNVITPQELDIYVPAKKLAIEYNGLYWHNINQKSSTYHQNKSDRCASIGVTLFHVFEDEWRDKRPIVESMIRHRLGLTTRKIAARKCTVRKLVVHERQAFFNANHVDGDTNAKLAIGLFLNDELVAAISLRVPFHKKHVTSLEVARMCGKLDTNVQGSLSRLTRAAASEARTLGYRSMLTYVDARFGASGTWTSAGWIHVSDTPARFWWTDDISRFNRFKYKADSKNGLTEEQVASSAGVVKIFGCKNLCYRFDC